MTARSPIDPAPPAKSGSLPNWVIVVIVLAVLTMFVAPFALGGIVAFSIFNKTREENAAAMAASEADAKQQTAKAQKLEAELREGRAKEEALNAQLASAKDEPTRRALQAQLDDEKERNQALKHPGAPDSDKPKAACKCTPGDPLCSCL